MPTYREILPRVTAVQLNHGWRDEQQPDFVERMVSDGLLFVVVPSAPHIVAQALMDGKMVPVRNGDYLIDRGFWIEVMAKSQFEARYEKETAPVAAKGGSTEALKALLAEAEKHPHKTAVLE